MSMPGNVQESLRAVIEAIPEMEVVGTAGGGLSAIALIRETMPDVIIIDGSLSEDEVLTFLKDAKLLSPDLRLIVLSYSIRQQKRLLKGGADAVFSRWSPAEEFSAVLIGTQ